MVKSYKRPVAFTHTVTTAEGTAGAAVIDLFNTTTDYPILLLTVRTAAGVDKTGDLVVTYSRSTGAITVADGSTSTIDATDIVDGFISFYKA